MKKCVFGSTILNARESRPMEPYVRSDIRNSAFAANEKVGVEPILKWWKTFKETWPEILSDHQIYQQLRQDLSAKTVGLTEMEPVSLSWKSKGYVCSFTFPNKKYAEYLLGVGVLNRRGAYNLYEARDYMDFIHPRHEVDALYYLNNKED